MITSLAYMDDTQWLAESKESLEKILEIADNFYNFADIQVNKLKSELLVKQHSTLNPIDYDSPISLRFGNQTVNIKPTLPQASTRILGVWFNLNNSRKYVLNQCKQEIIDLSALMKSKPITDKHVLYIYNKLIILRIEYRSQITILTKQECDSLMGTFRIMFKHKLK